MKTEGVKNRDDRGVCITSIGKQNDVWMKIRETGGRSDESSPDGREFWETICWIFGFAFACFLKMMKKYNKPRIYVCSETG